MPPGRACVTHHQFEVMGSHFSSNECGRVIFSPDYIQERLVNVVLTLKPTILISRTLTVFYLVLGDLRDT